MKIAIFDMDGTLANVDHRRHFVERQPAASHAVASGEPEAHHAVASGQPKAQKRDFESFYAAMGDDTPNRDVIAVLHALEGAGWHIIICTGRPESYRAITDGWCWKYEVYHAALYMRRDDEKFRKDCDVKQDMLDMIKREHGDKITELIAFDDRDQVVAMWRANGGCSVCQ